MQTRQDTEVIELLYFAGCPSALETEAVLRRVLKEEGSTATLVLIPVETPDEAAATGFLGSPTVRVRGQDIEPARVHEPGSTLSCRVYQTGNGVSGVPPEALLRSAVRSLAR
jgi:hypothetical protein